MLTALRNYYALSERIRPIPPGPALDATWWEYSGDAVGHDLDPPGWDTDDIDVWLDLAQLIARNEPRFLRQVGYPDDYVQRLRDVFGGLPDAEIDGYADPDGDRDEYEQEIGRLDEVGEKVGAIGERVEGIDGEVAEATDALDTRIWGLESELDDLPDEAEENNDWQSVARSSDEEFDIDKVFADL